MTPASPPIRRERIRLDGVTVHCAIAGAGAPVVLLHGWPQTWHAWRKLIPFLSGDYQVIVPDLPGFGDSSHPRDGFDKKTIAGIVRTLLQTLGHDRIRLVGHDVGGLVAYAYAAQWPAEVSHLALLECGIQGIMNADDANPLLGGSWHYAFNMTPDLAEFLLRDREREFLRFVFFRDKVGLFDPAAIDEADLDVYAAGLRHPGGIRCSCEYYRSIARDAIDNEPWVASRLTMPTQVIGASESYGERWLRSVRDIAESTESVLIGKSGHYIPEERPAEVAQHLLRLFKR